MNNPYKVLGVSEGASQEEIRTAYLKLVKKYHPDKYTDTDLKELANEKLVEINEAYEALTKKASSSQASGSGTYSNYGYSGQGSTYSGPSAADFARAVPSSTRTTCKPPSRCSIAFPCATQSGITFTASSISAKAGTTRRTITSAAHIIRNLETRSMQTHIKPCARLETPIPARLQDTTRPVRVVTFVPGCSVRIAAVNAWAEI